MKLKKIVAIPASALAVMAVTAQSAFATTSTANPVVSAISTQATALTSDAGTVIASGLSIGVVFFGAKLLWSKFKSMAR